MSTNFDSTREQILIRDRVKYGMNGITILTGETHQSRLFRGNIFVMDDGSFKGYGHGFRWKGSGSTGYEKQLVEEFLIGCYAMNEKSGDLGYAFYRLANDERYGEEEKNDPYWHKPQIIIAVWPFMVLDEACTDGVYRPIKADRTVGILHSSQIGDKWKEPVQDFNERLNLNLGENRIYAEKGIEYCRKIVREL
ncbi:hypothetical protein IKW73_00430 [Candidatus Saccharibacteria bacterium]|nr:hypothetical protein [Candidatus Saccharibacteria bacterium]